LNGALATYRGGVAGYRATAARPPAPRLNATSA
jgi:hypothetical protein